MRKDISYEMFVNLMSELKSGEYIVACNEKVQRRLSDKDAYKEVADYRAVSLRDGAELLGVQRVYKSSATQQPEMFDIDYEVTCRVLGRPVCFDTYSFFGQGGISVYDIDKRAQVNMGQNMSGLWKELEKRVDNDFDYKLAESLLKMRRAQMARARASMHDDFNR